MVEIAPFRAWEFDPLKAPLDEVVAPPYDVIGEELEKKLRKSSPHNVVHVTLPQAPKTGKKKSDPLAEADRLLEAWVAEGVLRPTPDEVIYAYQCEYTRRGVPKRMRGVVTRVRLDPTYRSVVPHEEIFPGPTEVRVKILEATAVDLEPIHLLYSGRSAEETLWAYVDGSQRRPDLAATGPDGAVHKFWRISDPAVIGTLVDAFKGRKAYIADGHHRYSAACRYAELRRSRAYRPPKNAAWEYKMSLIVNMADPGLSILPTHRVIKKLATKDPAKLAAKWSAHFDVKPVSLGDGNPVSQIAAAMEATGRTNVAGVWLGEKTKGYLLEAKMPIVPDTVVPGKSQTWRSLGVVFLQKLALEDGMGITAEKAGTVLQFTRDDDEAVAWVRKKKAAAVALHTPTQLAQMRAIADGGEKMPQKSTYFLPKILSGVMMHPLGKATLEPTRPRITS